MRSDDPPEMSHPTFLNVPRLQRRACHTYFFRNPKDALPEWQRSIILERNWGEGYCEQAACRTEALYQRALAMREQAFGPEHPVVAITLNNLAGLYHDKGDYGRTETLRQRVLTIREQTLGPDHPDTAAALNNLATLYLDTEKYDRAESLL